MSAEELDLKELVKLDKGRHYGICTPPHEGAHYDQDGILFDQNGELCEHLLNHESRNKLQKIAMRKQADLAAARARAAAYKKMGADGEAIEKELTPAAKANANPSDVDLVGWALGRLTIPWPEVRRAAQEQYGLAESSIASSDYLKNWMKENGKMDVA